MGSACDVSGAAHLPARLRPHPERRRRGRPSVTALRLEGVAPSVAHRKAALEALLKSVSARWRRVETDRLAPSGQAVRDAAPFSVGDERAALADFDRADQGRRARGADRGRGARRRRSTTGPAGSSGSRCRPSDDAGARARPRRAGTRPAGMPRWSARPPRCAPRSTCSQPQEPALAALTKRVKESFDPKGVLNPGRMWAGV